jgi:hypothetical protein
MIKKFRSSFSFGAQITAAGRAVRVARDFDHPVSFQVNEHLANPVATTACRPYDTHGFRHNNSLSIKGFEKRAKNLVWMYCLPSNCL